MKCSSDIDRVLVREVTVEVNVSHHSYIKMNLSSAAAEGGPEAEGGEDCRAAGGHQVLSPGG